MQHLMHLERSELGQKIWLRCDCGWLTSVRRHSSVEQLVRLHGGTLGEAGR